MKTKAILLLRIAFFAIGSSALFIDLKSNIEYMMQSESGPSALVAAVPILGIATTLCLPAYAYSRRLGLPFHAIGFLFLLCILSAFTLTATLDRFAGSLDKRHSATKAHNLDYDLAKEERQEAQDALKAAIATRTAESLKCPKGKKPPCIGPNWRVANESVASARLALDQATLLLRAARAPRTVDPASTTIHRLTGLDIATIQTYHPFTLPLGLFLTGVLFLGIALAPGSPTIRPDIPEPVAPLSLQIASYIQKEKQLQGKKPPVPQIANHFGVHRSTIYRNMKR